MIIEKLKNNKKIVASIAVLVAVWAIGSLGIYKAVEKTNKEYTDFKTEVNDTLKEINSNLDNINKSINNNTKEINDTKNNINNINNKIKTMDSKIKQIETSKKESRTVVKTASRGRLLSDKTNSSGRKGKRIEMVVTHYCPCKKCNGKWTGQPTTSGSGYTVGKTIAVPSDLLGKDIYIEGYGMRKGQDTGNAIKWIEKGKKVKIDMYVSNHSEAMKKGVVYTYGYIY